MSAISGNYSSVNVNVSVSTTTSSGKLSQFADKMGGIQQNINALVDQLMAEQKVLGGMREELRDVRSEIHAAREQKQALMDTKPQASSYVKADGSADTEAYQAALSTWSSANQSTIDSLDSKIFNLGEKAANLESRIEHKEAEIDRTRDKIEHKKQELDNVKAEARRAQAGGTSSSSGTQSVGSSNDADEVRDAAELNKANIVKTQIQVGIASDNISAGNASRNQMNALINVSAATTAGIDAQDSCSVSVDIQLMWTNNYAENFNNALKSGDTAAMQSQFAQFVKDIHTNGMPVDVNALVQQVLRESYVDTTADLKFYADKVQYFNDAKKQCREYVQEMRDYKTGMSSYMTDKGYCLSSPPSSSDKKTGSEVAGSALEDFNALVKQYISDNPIPRATSNDEETTKMINDIGLNDFNFADITNADNLDSMIESLEEKLNTLGDDSQLANTDLQNILQKQQQTLQMMSNISKTLSDTALAVIRKIG